ncbi:MAG: hypothetical protein R3305_05495 [Gammaproteobacteria bacterium]|nr:hypothetical protein [Gammaproteobacteria bacterium]
MGRAMVTSSEFALDAAGIDALVGSYAAIGAASLKRRRRKQLAIVAGCGGLLIALGFWGRADWVMPLPVGLDQSVLAEFQANIEAQIDGELSRLSQERAVLEQQRVAVDEKLAELSAQLVQFERQARNWEQQRASLDAQERALTAAIARLDAERERYAAAADGLPSLEAQLNAIGAERAELDRQRREFAAEDAAIDDELDALLQQRQDVEAQREALERQRAELEALLFDEQGGAAAGRGLPSAPALANPALNGASEEVASFYAEGSAQLASLIAAEQEAEMLDKMRAGFRLGDGIGVSLGLTRTTSVNGVEQLHDSIDLGQISAGLDVSALDSIGGIVIQNGAGNSIGSHALDAVSSGYGSIIQNTLDGQTIRTETIYDIRVDDISNAINGLAGQQAISESLRFEQ